MIDCLPLKVAFKMFTKAFYTMKNTSALLIALFAFVLSANAQPGGRPPGMPPAPAAAAGDSTAKKPAPPKTFKDIITDKAVSMVGMLTTHQVGDKYYFEIPNDLFGREIMAITRISKAPTGAGYGGEQANRQVVRFEKGPSNNVFLRVVSYINVAASEDEPIAQAVRNSNVEPIAAAFDIKFTKKDTSVLIEVGDFFNGDNQVFSLPPTTKQQYRLNAQQKDRSYMVSLKAFPINVEVRSVKTFGVNPPSPGGVPGGNRTVDLPAGIASGFVTLEMNTSMVLLPKEPMRKRYFDPRVGLFATRSTVYEDNSQRTEQEIIAVRWRLEAKNAEDAARQQRGELIEPAKPIVFYIDPATPLKWRPYLKKGVEDWQAAFEQAGWKNAILAKDWPENDPNMSLEDARYSVIRYFASDIENAYGPNVNDPRSGEIIESHIGWYHNVMKLLKRWYTTQTAAADPRARATEFSDELMGELVRFVSSHEVGHTIGLRHNFGASNATPVEKLRDKAFIKENGHTSSIMDYARFNYVAQPEDGLTDFFPRIGDYDKWAIEWAYKPIYNTQSAEEDKKILNKWYLEKAAGNKRLHFLTESSPIDPRAQSEDLGDNSMLASEYGIKNLQRLMPNLVAWSKAEAEDYDMVQEMYGDIVAQYRRYIGHVTKWVGGIFENPKTHDQQGVVYEPAPKAMQQSAVAFLNKQLFQTPAWLYDQKVMSLIASDMGVASLAQIQESALNSLHSSSRLQRLMESKSAYPNAYGLDEMYADLKAGIWSELRSNQPVSVHRRNLQRMYLDKLIAILNPDDSAPAAAPAFSFGGPATPSMDILNTDVASITRATLKEIHSELKAKVAATTYKLTKIHYEDCIRRIEEGLDKD